MKKITFFTLFLLPIQLFCISEEDIEKLKKKSKDEKMIYIWKYEKPLRITQVNIELNQVKKEDKENITILKNLGLIKDKQPNKKNKKSKS